MKLKSSAIVALALASSASLGAAEKLMTGTINVVNTTPLPSIGLPLNIIPANIQIVNRADLKNQAGVSIVDFANNNLQGVSIQETQGNPFQPDVTFRGYSASPLGGSPQGISVFLDGVRMNEPFGDSVRWDLIPTFAIQGMQMVPGSNPVYGLNTLGGAIAIQTKSGRTNQGVALEASAGSWGRKNVTAEYGGLSKDGSVDYYLGVNYLDENGWRKFSPTTVKQTFGKVGWQSESTKIDLSYLGVNNDMIGNGLVPQELMTSFGRDAIHTQPDQTRNSLSQITLNGSHWFNNDVMFSANTYYRRSNQKTLNGDVNDGFTGDLDDPANGCGGAGETDENCAQSVFNKTRTRTTAAGISAQLAFNQNIFNKKNQLIVGTGFDRSMSKYGQFEQEFNSWDSSRYPAGGASDDQETATNFMGKTTSSNIFATDTLSINELVHVTAGLRYNYSKVNNKDFLVGTDGHIGDAGGRHSFSRVNPSLGLTLTPNQNISIYGSYSESNRAPTAMELACADPAAPCLLPNAMASDPPLKQVVAKTYDLGAKGNLGGNLKWNASVYQAVNHNDLQFIHSGIGTNTSLGYFDNVGRTKRQGLDLGLSTTIDKLSLTGSYGYVRATYDDEFTLSNESNSSNDEGTINVTKGKYLAGIPKHQFKLRAQYEVLPAWTVGANLVAFSSRYMHGNENNGHKANSAACALEDDGGQGDEIPCGKGKTGGYVIVNLDTQYNVGSGWKVFAKAINIFDKDYETTGRLGTSHFGSTGIWNDDTTGTRLVAPGAPRAGWIGFRYEFGGAPEAK